MIDRDNTISLELSKTLPANLFRWPKYLWVDDRAERSTYIVRSKFSSDCPFDTYPALTRKEIVKRLSKFVQAAQGEPGGAMTNQLLKDAGLLPLELEFQSKTPDQLLKVLLEIINIRN